MNESGVCNIIISCGFFATAFTLFTVGEKGTVTIYNYGFNGDIDILSLDIDGIDYWFMKSLKEYINPRVIVLEFQDIIPSDLSITLNKFVILVKIGLTESIAPCVEFI